MKGPIKWMAENHVAANILMLIFVVGGLVIGKSTKQEVFPEFNQDMVSISVSYRGASPEEVEDGIVKPLEQAVSGIDGVKRITATAREGVGSVNLELIDGYDPEQVLEDAKALVSRITTLPEDSEEPVISKAVHQHEVISLVVYGDVTERALSEQAERIRDDLLSSPLITQIEIGAAREQEISIEISEDDLSRYNLTLNQLATIIKRSSLDMPGGSIKSEGGEVLIRTNEKRYFGGEFDSITVFTSPSGEKVLLGDIAKVNDGFEDSDREFYFDGKRALMIDVYRVGDQTPVQVARETRKYLAEIEPQLPSSIKIAVWSDDSLLLQDRFNLLLRNGMIGFILVLITLALFLEIRLAFWVAIGAAISFIGAFMAMPIFGVSINMLSLFAFLIVLGIVVDDAIIVGENIFVHRRMGKNLSRASIDGTIEVTRAVIFAVLTSIAAFAPLLFVTGTMGKIMGVVPIIVISVLTISIIESLFILPAHLSGGLASSRLSIWSKIESKRSRFDRFVDWLINKTYAGTLDWVVRNRYLTISLGLAVLLVTIGFITGGHIKFVFREPIDADWVNAQLTLSPGTPYSETKRVTERIQAAGKEVAEEYSKNNGQDDLLHIYTTIGSSRSGFGSSNNSANVSRVQMLFRDSDTRVINLREFSSEWRKRLGSIPNVESLNFRSQMMGRGSDIDIQLSHSDYSMLLQAVTRLRKALAGYGGVEEVNDSFAEGKRELKLKLKPEAESLGITETDLAQQVRAAFYGVEAQRLQRERNEIRVIVRYPTEDLRKLATIENMRVRTPSGGEIPLKRAAYIQESRGFSEINRTDQKRVVDVTADINTDEANAADIIEDIEATLLKQLIYEYPGLSYDLEGDAREQNESMASLGMGFLLALFAIYALLAVPFASFVQPFIVMSAIPFGIVGAVIGHALLGYDLSLISGLGIVALAGVVVNDSLVMIDFINQMRKEGVSVDEAVLLSGKRRFRPIIMTSLTTFFGLTPIILETSIQARFMIPMAISLGFGVLFATGITLILVPALYLALEDVYGFFRRRNSHQGNDRQ